MQENNADGAATPRHAVAPAERVAREEVRRITAIVREAAPPIPAGIGPEHFQMWFQRLATPLRGADDRQ